MNAVYVDTVGSFAYCGAARVAHDLRGQLENAIASSSGVDDPRAAPNLAPSAILDGVSVFRVHGAHELVALLAQFDQICREITNAGLLVINTVSWPFLASFPNNIIRRQVMHTEFARTLSEIAAKHQIAIVLVSQSKAADHGSPQDGDVWGRVSANRLLLRVSGDGYVARLTSSSMNPTGECYVGPKAAHHQ
ncbi:hypothetical protein GQ54DRAFT_296901 [Martensiomyces pterosporus]|nr:hypothetical protein GQ54DRAFT_296901 [Martensiomyces pterosporus]